MRTQNQLPIVVDLDGTLTPVDTLHESICLFIKKYPLKIFFLLFWVFQGKAEFKSNIASHVSLTVETLPYNKQLIDYLKSQREAGRKIILATAAHISIARSVSDYLGIFDKVLATQGNDNLKGKRKLEKIKSEIGSDFIYAGDSKVDIPVWECSKAAILVDVSNDVAKRVRSFTNIEKEFTRDETTWKTWARALRVHQWIKNFLIFVPLLTSFEFLNSNSVIFSLLAFISFSILASGTYLVNDLLDLPSDRVHPTKRNRPLANVEISIANGALAAFIAIGSGLLIGLFISVNFFLMLLLYLLITSTYSFVFKELIIIDVIVLSALYTIRILSGSVAIHVNTSTWLLLFSIFIFTSLALVKRCSELVKLKNSHDDIAHGRGYKVSHLTLLWPLGIGSAVASVIVFGLFVSSSEVLSRYETPQLLWLVAVGLIYWLTRIWTATAKGQMSDDPLVYSINNRGSLITILSVTTLIVLAHYF